jgi:serine/threonine protein kinase
MGNLESSSGHPIPEHQQQQLSIGGRTVSLRKKLGEGAYSFVFLVQDIRSGQLFALKRILAQDKESDNLAKAEIQVMELVGRHPGLVRLEGYCSRVGPGRGQMEYFLLLENCPNGSLMNRLKSLESKGERIPEKQALEMLLEMTKGVLQLHRLLPPVAHRDLKMENVLVGEDGKLKICDFGSCTSRAKVYSTQEEIAAEEERIAKFSTPSYRAPEMVDLYQKVKVDEKVDIWVKLVSFFAISVNCFLGAWLYILFNVLFSASFSRRVKDSDCIWKI